jgi:hypothetical protein
MLLYRWNKLPLKIRTYFLPNLILCVQFALGLEEGKVLEVFIFPQKFTKLVENIGVTQKVLPL